MAPLPILTRLIAALAIGFLTFTSSSVSANTAPNARAPAGYAEFVLGTVIAQALDGQSRVLAKGDVIHSGDKINTQGGRVQLRFTDGAFVSLLPETEFHIRDYRYDGNADGNETGFFALLKGTARFVTGVIGRVNRARFQLSTPTATIGVRGTGGVISVALDGTTRLLSTQGIWIVSNANGTLDVPAGTAVVVSANRSAPPRVTWDEPPAATAPLAQLPERRTSDILANVASRNGATTTLSSPSELESSASAPRPSLPPSLTPLPAPLDPGAGSTTITGLPGTNPGTPAQPATPAGTPGDPINALTAAYGFGFEALLGNAVTTNTGFGFARNGAAGLARGPDEVVVAVNGEVQRIGEYALSSQSPPGKLQEGGTDGLIHWGRWRREIDTANGTVRLGPDEGFHFAVGPPTVGLASAGLTGFAAYTLTSATAPTIVGANVPKGTLSANMGVDFSSGRIGLDLTAAFPQFNVIMGTNGGAAQPNQSNTVFDAKTAEFKGDFAAVRIEGRAPPNVCPAPCTGQFQGFFAGPAAAQAGLVYRTVGGTPGAVEMQGAAVFKKAP